MAEDKLKVWWTSERSFLFPFKQPGAILKLLAIPVGLWLLLSLLLFLAFRSQPDFDPEMLEAWISLLALLLFLPAMIRGHRLVLLQETPGYLPLRDYIHRRTFWFLGATVLLIGAVLLCLTPILLPMLLFDKTLVGNKATLVIGPLFILAALALACAIGTRFALVFPNIAVDSPLKLREVVRLSKGNRLRIFWIVFSVQAPFHLLDRVVSRLPEGGALGFLLSAVLILSAVCATAVQIYALSDIYRELLIMKKRRRDAAAGTTALV